MSHVLGCTCPVHGVLGTKPFENLSSNRRSIWLAIAGAAYFDYHIGLDHDSDL